MAEPEFYAAHGHEWNHCEAQLEAARHRVTLLYARWQELEALRAALA